jgi:hypothetical protein
LWLAASVKFLIPFSLLVGIGSYFQRQTNPVAASRRVSVIVGAISQPFATSHPSLVSLSPAQAHPTSWILVVLAGVWIRVEPPLVVYPIGPAPRDDAAIDCFES